MARLLANHAKDKKMKDPILGISKQIQEAKEQGTFKINATLGMFFDDEGEFLSYPTVQKTIDSLKPVEKYRYAPIDGGKNYHEVVKSWVFGKHKVHLESNMHIGVVASAGGTGAISNTFSNYLNHGDAILIPDIAWVYKKMAKEYHLKTQTYSLFTEDERFNVDSLKEEGRKLLDAQERLLIVINDPCHNPTGYTLKDSEWDEVFAFVNEVGEEGYPVVLLHDIAYLDYNPQGYDKAREVLSRYAGLHENILGLIAFSGSKAFSSYGLRIGAQIALSKNPEVIEDFRHANQVSSRAKWSNPTKIGVSLVEKLLGDKERVEAFQNELVSASETLKRRGETFTALAHEKGIEMHPYVGGFFVTIPSSDPQSLADKLKEEGIFVAAMPSVVRISLAAIDEKTVRTLLEDLHKVMT